MLLYFKAKLDELNLAHWQFFEIAYYKKFGKVVDLKDDGIAFQLHGVIPSYVVEYLRSMQNAEAEHPIGYEAAYVPTEHT
jgi:hypothetical protein